MIIDDRLFVKFLAHLLYEGLKLVIMFVKAVPKFLQGLDEFALNVEAFLQLVEFLVGLSLSFSW